MCPNIKGDLQAGVKVAIYVGLPPSHIKLLCWLVLALEVGEVTRRVIWGRDDVIKNNLLT